MTDTASRFITRTRQVTPVGGAISLLLEADPQRWWVTFSTSGAPGEVPQIFPGPFAGDFPPTTRATYDGPYKFHDCPSVVTGEWYVFGDGATVYTITESLMTKG